RMSGRYSGPWTALKERLEAHCAAGELLDGYRFEVGAFEEGNGERDLPCVRMELPNIAERYKADQMVGGEFVIVLSVTVSRKTDGIVGSIAAIELVLDAIETNAAGTVDPS